MGKKSRATIGSPGDRVIETPDLRKKIICLATLNIYLGWLSSLLSLWNASFGRYLQKRVEVICEIEIL